MLECLVLLTFFGLVVASQKKMGLGNPFQIYFFIWFLVFLGYYVLRDSFIDASPIFLWLMFAVKAGCFLILSVITLERPKHFNLGRDVLPAMRIDVPLVLAAQFLVIVMLPFMYVKAVNLAGGGDVFSVVGYIKLRAAMTQEGEGYGFLAYFRTLAFVLSSILLWSYFNRATGIFVLIISVLASLLYAYLSTGRTFVLFFATIMFFPLVLRGSIKTKGLLLSALLVLSVFAFVATMTAKGVSLESGVLENLESLFDNLRGYTVAPLLALSNLMNYDFAPEWGANTFRVVVSLLYAFGLTDSPPAALIRDFAFVPDPTNVYTVYEGYFRDFSYAGLFAPLIFMAGHWWLYVRARKMGGVWVFYYSASLFALLMQFFQDQYFSLLSMWLQTGFWYWLFTKSGRVDRIGNA